MPRAPRVTIGGIAYHVLNRANARMTLFENEADYQLMVSVLAEAHERVAMRTLGWCIMPNHWHLVLWPRGDGDLPEFMRWLTVTHTQRWHAAHGTAGTGHVYQGRYKSFPIQRTRPSRQQRSMGMLEGGDAVLSVLRYVERNPVRAGLSTRAETWRWSSAYQRANAEAESGDPSSPTAWGTVHSTTLDTLGSVTVPDPGQSESGPEIPFSEPPTPLPADWLELVNRPQSQKELDALVRCIQRGCPFGRDNWVRRMAAEWNIESTLRPRGRPKKTRTGS